MGELLPGDMILGIDPGGTTGLLLAKYNEGFDFDVLAAIDIPWNERWDVAGNIIQLRPAHIVVERFVLYKHKMVDQINSDFPSVRVIGIAELAWWANCPDSTWIEQPASERKNVEILPQHRPLFAKLHHAKDAYMHVRYFVIMTVKRQRHLERMAASAT